MRFVVFPGQGSQYPGMSKDWCENFKEASLAFEEASDLSSLPLKKIVFDGTDSDLKKTEITQPAILTATVAIFRVLESQFGLDSLETFVFAGHSLGEYSALVNAKTISLGQAARLVSHRGRYMQESVPAGLGKMAALVYKPKVDGSALSSALCQEVSAKLRQTLTVANFNSPEQIVIAGNAEAVDEACRLSLLPPYSARKSVELSVSAPFHCPLMKPASDRLEPELHEAPWLNQKTSRYIANVDAQLHSLGDAAAIAPRLAQQIYQPVRWVESVQKAIESGCTEAIEIGPGRVLSGLIKRISFQEQSLEVKNIDRFEDFKNAGSQL